MYNYVIVKTVQRGYDILNEDKTILTKNYNIYISNAQDVAQKNKLATEFTDLPPVIIPVTAQISDVLVELESICTAYMLAFNAE